MDAKTIIVKRIALELEDGMLVNLGIGLPTEVANHVPAGMTVFFQSENGIIGMGARAPQGLGVRQHPHAGGQPITAGGDGDDPPAAEVGERGLDDLLGGQPRPAGEAVHSHPRPLVELRPDEAGAHRGHPHAVPGNRRTQPL